MIPPKPDFQGADILTAEGAFRVRTIWERVEAKCDDIIECLHAMADILPEALAEFDDPEEPNLPTMDKPPETAQEVP